MWLAYATAVLDKEGHTVHLQDAVADKSTKEQVVEKAKQFKTDMVMVDTSTASIYNDVEVATAIGNPWPFNHSSSSITPSFTGIAWCLTTAS